MKLHASPAAVRAGVEPARESQLSLRWVPRLDREGARWRRASAGVSTSTASATVGLRAVVRAGVEPARESQPDDWRHRLHRVVWCALASSQRGSLNRYLPYAATEAASVRAGVEPARESQLLNYFPEFTRGQRCALASSQRGSLNEVTLRPERLDQPCALASSQRGSLNTIRPTCRSARPVCALASSQRGSLNVNVRTKLRSVSLCALASSQRGSLNVPAVEQTLTDLEMRAGVEPALESQPGPVEVRQGRRQCALASSQRGSLNSFLSRLSWPQSRSARWRRASAGVSTLWR